MKKKLLSFFIVGTQIAGATTLHKWLSYELDIYLSIILFKNGNDWYLNQFPQCKKGAVLGEVDPI